MQAATGFRGITAGALLLAILSIATAKYSGGTGEPNDPYQIATAADLVALGETPADYDKHFLLTADIDLDPNLPGRKVFNKAVIAPDVDPTAHPIYQGTSFQGTIDGQGHRIVNLTISGDGYLGLIGALGTRGLVSHVGVEAVEVTGTGDKVGGLVGCNFGAVADSYTTGVVNGNWSVGGLAGTVSEGAVTACRSAASVSGVGYVGGLIGCNWGPLSDSCSTGSVRGDVHVGGLVGDNVESIIVNCCSTGPVSGRSGVGGLVGANHKADDEHGGIFNSYSTGAASGAEMVGGLVGNNDSGVVSNSYSAGSVSGHENVGGLVGYDQPTWNPWDGRLYGARNSFWDVNSSGQAGSAGGIGKTTKEMQTAGTFRVAGWDFVGETANGTEDVWWIREGKDYPRLWWERVLGDDFEDSEAEPLWFVYEVDSEFVQITEVNGRLETTASAEAQNVDAFYVSDGWRFDVTKGFAMQVDFHFGNQGGGDGRVTLGVVPSLDPAAMQWAELEAGCFDTGPFYLYEVRDGFWVQERVTGRSSDDGTLYMSYEPDTDELHFSHTGYGKANAWQTVTGLLKGRWASEPVYVILGGGSEGMALNPGDAWLDNFILTAGVLIRAEADSGSGPVEEQSGAE